MWGRAAQVMLGLWIACSPFIFDYSPDDTLLWVNDLVVASVVIVFSLLSCWERAEKLNVVVTAVSLWLMLFGYFGFDHVRPPGIQSGMIVGLTLLMFSLVPRLPSDPPISRRRPDASIERA